MTSESWDGVDRRGPDRPWSSSPATVSPAVDGAVVATGAASRASRTRERLHLVLGAGSWVAFALIWRWHLVTDVPEDLPRTLLTIGGFLAAFCLATPAWVAWNRNIYKRRHRRTSAIVRPVAFERDWTGRRVVPVRGARHHVGEVVVDLATAGGLEVKTYEPTTPPAPEWETTRWFGDDERRRDHVRRVA